MDPYNPKIASAADFVENFKRLGKEYKDLTRTDKIASIYLADWHGFNFSEIMEAALWEEVTVWENMNIEEVAIDMVQEGDAFPDCPEEVKPYLDYALIGKELVLSGFDDTGVHTFFFMQGEDNE